MTIQSEVTGAFYEPANCCFIMNAKQTALYMKYGVKLLDVLVSKDDKLVYVSTRSIAGSFIRSGWIVS